MYFFCFKERKMALTVERRDGGARVAQSFDPNDVLSTEKKWGNQQGEWMQKTLEILLRVAAQRQSGGFVECGEAEAALRYHPDDLPWFRENVDVLRRGLTGEQETVNQVWANTMLGTLEEGARQLQQVVSERERVLQKITALSEQEKAPFQRSLLLQEARATALETTGREIRASLDRIWERLDGKRIPRDIQCMVDSEMNELRETVRNCFKQLLDGLCMELPPGPQETP